MSEQKMQIYKVIASIWNPLTAEGATTGETILLVTQENGPYIYALDTGYLKNAIEISEDVYEYIYTEQNLKLYPIWVHEPTLQGFIIRNHSVLLEKLGLTNYKADIWFTIFYTESDTTGLLVHIPFYTDVPSTIEINCIPVPVRIEYTGG